MCLKAVLFDLDGTLLPMDQNEFIAAYFGSLSLKMSARGYDQNDFIAAIQRGCAAMVKNDGTATNEEAFWKCFRSIYPDISQEDIAQFEEYYNLDFDNVKAVCKPSDAPMRALKHIIDAGCRVALATNPLFPSVATEKRIGWAGMTPDMFEFYTTYSDSRYCKPNINYYKELVSLLGVEPHEILMVGNDVDEDMVAKELGMEVFLITDFVINKNNKDISVFPNGSFDELKEYFDSKNR